jgi:hypothetical protein
MNTHNQIITGIKCNTVDEFRRSCLKLSGQSKTGPHGCSLGKVDSADWDRGVRYILSYSNKAQVAFSADDQGLKRAGARATIVEASDFLSR